MNAETTARATFGMVGATALGLGVAAFGMAVDDLATAGVLVPGNWPSDQVVEEHRVIDIPLDQPHPKYHVLVTVNDEPFLDHRYPEIYQWVDLGFITVERSKTTALAPL